MSRISLQQFKGHVLVEIEQARAQANLDSLQELDEFVQEVIDREMRKLSSEQASQLLLETLYAALAKELK